MVTVTSEEEKVGESTSEPDNEVARLVWVDHLTRHCGHFATRKRPGEYCHSRLIYSRVFLIEVQLV